MLKIPMSVCVCLGNRKLCGISGQDLGTDLLDVSKKYIKSGLQNFEVELKITQTGLQ